MWTALEKQYFKFYTFAIVFIGFHEAHSEYMSVCQTEFKQKLHSSYFLLCDARACFLSVWKAQKVTDSKFSLLAKMNGSEICWIKCVGVKPIDPIICRI